MRLLEALTEVPSWRLWAGAWCVYHLAYPALHSLALHHPRYRELSPQDQMYVCSNGLKALVLGGFSTIMTDTVWDVLWTARWNGPVMQVLAPIYVCLDLVSLYRVPKHANSTLLHHVCVVLFGLAVAARTAGPGTYEGQICVYALFSMLAYFVNGLLALRKVASPEAKPFVLRCGRMCGVGYAAVCAVHWPFQAYCAYQHSLWVLPCLFYPFVMDDLVLMRWLLNPPPNTAPPELE